MKLRILLKEEGVKKMTMLSEGLSVNFLPYPNRVKEPLKLSHLDSASCKGNIGI